MRDTELYRKVLGLESPWRVSRVELSLEHRRVDVWTDHGRGERWPCPECGQEFPVYDHSEERSWRHLDTCQLRTFLHARAPRVRCPEHGVKQVEVPWAEVRSRFTALFECLAITVLQETHILGATRILGISWDEAWHLLERAVARGQAAKPARVCRRIGVDEKAAAKGHRYLTLVNDLERSTVEYIADGRTRESLDGYFEALSPAQREGIKAVAMDMWEPYVQSVRAHLEEANEKIVFDRFHIDSHMSKAVDQVRRREHRGLLAEGDDRLTGSKYLWLYGRENLPAKHRRRFAALKEMHLKTGRAWAIKENLREMWKYRRIGSASRYWRRWYFWATHSRLKPVIAVARMIECHLQSVMNFFAHRITNAVSEGLNSKIQTVKKMAAGFRNREHFKTAIYFHCGGLQLYPATHGIVG